MRTFTIVAALLLIALPLAADEQVAPRRCNLTGTWYGGSSAQTPYLLTVSTGHGGRYTVNFQLAVTPGDFGIDMWTSWTSWSGEAVETEPGEFEVRAVSYWILNHEYAVKNGIDDSAPEFDMVRATARFVDCNTISMDVDFFAAFYAFDPAVDTPFVPPYDWELPPGETIHETYRRMQPLTTMSALPLPPRMSGSSVPTTQRRWRNR